MPACCGIIARPIATKDSSLSEISPKPPIVTEVVIIGAGPCGLFQVFELGLLGITCHLVDSLGAPGGQCTELYPDKPIYDIPALPICGAQELIDRLLQQIAPFNAPLHLGQEVTRLHKREDGRFDVRDRARHPLRRRRGGHRRRRRFVPAAAHRRAGRGSVRRHGSIHYRVRDAAQYHGKKLAIFGGGDSALDWVIDFAGKAAAITHIHRRAGIQGGAGLGGEDARAGGCRSGPVHRRSGRLAADGRRHVAAESTSRAPTARCTPSTPTTCSRSSACIPKLGPIAEWGMELEKKALKVDTEKFQTSVPGIFAVGDINTYPGKKKLILSGFHEAALAAFAIQHHLYPAKKQFLQYTTTSPVMQKRLGVPH